MIANTDELHLITLAVCEYEDTALNHLREGIKGSHARVLKTLAPFGYKHVLELEPNRDILVDQLYRYMDERKARITGAGDPAKALPHGMLILYVIGHGEPDRQHDHVLLMSNHKGRARPNTVITLEELTGWVVGELAYANVLCIFDTCYAGASQSKVYVAADRALAGSKHCAVELITTTTALAKAGVDAFSSALEAELSEIRYHEAEQWRDDGPFLPLGKVIERIDHRVVASQPETLPMLEQRILYGRPGAPIGDSDKGFLPNPHHRKGTRRNKSSRAYAPYALPGPRGVTGIFVGRAREQKQLRAFLTDGRDDVGVHGPLGFGTTALATQVLRDMCGADGGWLWSSPFPDGVITLTLDSLKDRPSSFEKLVWLLLVAFVPSTSENQDGQATRTQLCDVLAGKRLLIVLDGAQNGIDYVDKLTQMRKEQAAWTGVRFLITTSNSSLIPAQMPAVKIVSALSDEESQELLEERTKDCPLPEELKARVLKMLGGHPLALTWAGGHFVTALSSRRDLVKEWDQHELQGLRDPDLSRTDCSLGWFFEKTRSLLSDDARCVLDVGGSLAFGAYEEQTFLPYLPALGEHRVRAALEELVVHGVMMVNHEPASWMFTHELTRSFTRHKWTPEGDGPLRQEIVQNQNGPLREEILQNAGNAFGRLMGGDAGGAADSLGRAIGGVGDGLGSAIGWWLGQH